MRGLAIGGTAASRSGEEAWRRPVDRGPIWRHAGRCGARVVLRQVEIPAGTGRTPGWDEAEAWALNRGVEITAACPTAPRGPEVLLGARVHGWCLEDPARKETSLMAAPAGRARSAGTASRGVAKRTAVAGWARLQGRPFEWKARRARLFNDFLGLLISYNIANITNMPNPAVRCKA
ncbi:hypothetical protein NDU88_006300 [Pleurodeles waltl]|uniref:Transposase n=1 Tax=Pleurodeles waltl TaxID=8319 RepID=A0AAV7MCW5_PLEWA|nr:hypothetical protein NDU88_006300 [Pleurodeles waltl]